MPKIDEYGREYTEVGGPKKYYKKRVYRQPTLAEKLARNNANRPRPVSDNIWLKELADQLKLARYQQRLTQKQLAKELGTTQTYISYIENCRANPSVVFLERMTKALNHKLVVTPNNS